MAVTLNPLSRPSSLASFLETDARTAAAQTSAFEQQLLSAIRDSLIRVGIAADQIQVSLAAGYGGTRQIVVSLAQPAPAAAGAVQQPAASGSPAAAQQVEMDPVAVLKNALRAAGMNPDGFNLTESREIVGYPGGSYVNHLITAEFGGGLRECYGVELMLRNPQLTVLEMRRALSSLTSG